MKKSTLLAAASALALSVAISNVALANDPLIDDSLNNNDVNVADNGGTNVNDSLNNNDLFSNNKKTEIEAEEGGVAAGDDAYKTEIDVEKKTYLNSFNDTFTKTYNTAIAVDASRDGNILMANKVELKAVVAGIKLMPIADGYAKNSPEAKNFAEVEAENKAEDVKAGNDDQKVEQDSEQKAANLGLNVGLALNKNESEAENESKQFGKSEAESEAAAVQLIGLLTKNEAESDEADSEQKNEAGQLAASKAEQDNDTGSQDQSNHQDSDQSNGDQTQKAYAHSDQDADANNTQVAVADGRASNVSVAKLFLATGDIGGRWHNIRGITNVTLNTGFGAQNAVTNVNAMIGSVNGSGRITSGQ